MVVRMALATTRWTRAGADAADSRGNSGHCIPPRPQPTIDVDGRWRCRDGSKFGSIRSLLKGFRFSTGRATPKIALSMKKLGLSTNFEYFRHATSSITDCISYLMCDQLVTQLSSKNAYFEILSYKITWIHARDEKVDFRGGQFEKYPPLATNLTAR